MIKVLIADDEELFREGLAADVNWDKIGMKIVGMAEDGRHALELVKETSPDIIVTDIRMPYVDGLAFIRAVKEFKPELFFIIISGHDEFEYAQKAVRLGVREFLLKPIDDGELESSLLKVKDEIEKSHHLNLEQSLRDALLRQKLKIGIEKTYLHRILLIQWDDYPLEEEPCLPFYERIEEIVNNEKGAFLLERRRGEVVLDLTSLSDPGLSILTTRLIKNLRDPSSEGAFFSMTLGIGSVCSTIKELPLSYQHAREASGRKFLEGKNHTFAYENIQSDYGQKFVELSGWDMTALIGALKTGDEESLQNELDNLIQVVSKMGKDSFSYGLMIVGTLFSEVLKLVESSRGQSDDILSDSLGIYRQITSQQTIEEMLKELKRFLVRVMNHISMKRDGGHSLLLDRIKEFIKQNYCDSTISAQSVADRFSISSGHLCAIFQECSEVTFKEFLTQLRMERAKDLITFSDMLVFEIAYKIGYNNPTYFNSVFKKYTGMSPGKYKKAISRTQIKKIK